MIRGRSRNGTTKNFFDRGLTQSEVVERIAMSAFAVCANIIADATGTEADKMFATVEQ